ncbi:MAG TPA: ATP phosphoribosyltransferase regulatory subunit [Lachnospiraceae bacterium]|nr:ATP phosphoribosyltransferase regulatory subunit [Lachnospiraceae bacterium]
MINRVIHTPEGVRDIYGQECRNKKMLMFKLHQVFEKYGYRDIETPTFEFFDVFSNDIGTTPSNELYKFFDRDGNTLVLRPDFTPSVARAFSMHCHGGSLPVRLCYEGSTFVNSAEYQGRLKESTQMGVENIGDASAAADAEILSLTCELLLAAGLEEFQVSVGEVDFFKALAEDSGLDENAVEEVRKLISNKNFFGVSELLDAAETSDAIKEAFVRLPQLFGGPEILKEASLYAVNQKAAKAVERLEDIHSIMRTRSLEKYISYDLGSLSKYNYYTGIIFSAFTYGTGEPVAKGGRYDNLLGHFGKDYPAVGAGLYIDQLLSALERQHISFDGEVNEK